MGVYLLKRLLLFIPTLILASIIIFTIIRVIPGDPAVAMLAGTGGEGQFTKEQLERLRESLGTNKPILSQYFVWVGDVFRGDLGTSFWNNVAVADEIKSRFPVTFQLAVMSIIITFLISVPIGVATALKQDTWVDYLGKIFTVGGISMPTFWVGILVVYFLVRLFNWLPPLNYANLWEDPLTNLQQMIFPALALGYHNTAFTARLTRSAMLEVLREDYIRTARSKGLRELIVVFRHGLKNAVLPVLTVSGWQFGALLGGAILIEIIFLVPGMGQLIVDSIEKRDYEVIQAVVMLSVAVVLTLNLIVDLLYGWLDPKVRYS